MILDTATLEGDFLAILLHPITNLDEDRDRAVTTVIVTDEDGTKTTVMKGRY